MNRETTRIAPEDIARQREFCALLHERSAARPTPPLAFVDTYGCQQNEADSERLRGYLREMGFAFTDAEGEADGVCKDGGDQRHVERLQQSLREKVDVFDC